MTDARLEDHDRVLEQAQAWVDEGKNVALATVVKTWGSAPRPVGSQLVVDETGKFVGSVSGGCIEGAVVTESLAVIQDGAPRTLEYGVSNDEAWDVGLACGGQIKIFVEKLS
jgi:xanthine/CO dehydrogenase XdhC/CoxF family maturation factor